MSDIKAVTPAVVTATAAADPVAVALVAAPATVWVTTDIDAVPLVDVNTPVIKFTAVWKAVATMEDALAAATTIWCPVPVSAGSVSSPAPSDTVNQK